MNEEIQIGNARFHPYSRSFQILESQKKDDILLGRHLVAEKYETEKESNRLSLSYENGEKLEIGFYELNNNIKCYTIIWSGRKYNGSHPTDLFGSTDSKWFGGSEVYHQKWPVDVTSHPYKLQPYISGDMLLDGAGYGSVMERYFLNSIGYAIKIDESVPLWVGINEHRDGKICLMANHSGTALNNPVYCDYPHLKYDIVVGKNIKEIHKHVMENYYSKPTAMPDETMFKLPIWSTWAKYKTDITQKKVLEFAKEIEDSGYGCSQIEIDDKWMSAYGDMIFDSNKFPNPKDLVKRLHDKGLRVTVWCPPFANVDSKTFQKAMKCATFLEDKTASNSERLRSYMISKQDGTPSLVKWWDGYGVHVDFTKQHATEWFYQRHRKFMKEFGIDSFKFDAGECSYLPSGACIKGLNNSNDFTTQYVNTVSRFGGSIDVRVAYRTQDKGIFVRIMDKDSTWDFNNGLKTLVPTCLLFSILGYPFILPDMVGGNCYDQNKLPDPNLFIRWVQLNAFFPAMQFSISPKQFNDEKLNNICKRYTEIHQVFVTPIMLRYARLSTEEHGLPIIRPVWWMDPLDKTAHEIGDEFIIGDDVLVAPVTTENAMARDIYFPGTKETRWKHVDTERVYQGQSWIRNFPAPIEDIPYFVNLN